MKKGIGVAVVLLLLTAIGAGFLYGNRNALIRSSVEKTMSRMSGLEVRAGAVALDLKARSIEIDQIFLMNPDGFDLPVLAQASDLVLRFSLRALFLRGEARFASITAHLEQINVERNPAGEFNLNRLKAVLPEILDSGAGLEVAPLRSFRVDRAEISYGKLLLREAPVGESEALILEADLEGTRDLYPNIRDPYFLIQAPVMKILGTLNRGSLGLSRGKIQEKLRGKAEVPAVAAVLPLVASAEPAS